MSRPTEAFESFPEILRELAEIAEAALIEKGINPQIARAAACHSAARAHKHFGGQLIYIPRGLREQLVKRNVEIRRRLAAGDKPADICRAFNLSSRQLRRIETQH